MSTYVHIGIYKRETRVRLLKPDRLVPSLLVGGARRETATCPHFMIGQAEDRSGSRILAIDLKIKWNRVLVLRCVANRKTQ